MEHFLQHSGYLALVVLAFIEAACVPIPSEITFAFGGVLAHDGRLDLGLVIVLGTLAELLGSFVAYGIGRLGGRPLVDRLGRYVLLTRADLDRSERWLAGRGGFAIAIGRMLPVLRLFVSIVAGVAEMPFPRFVVASFFGTLAYVAALSSLGYGLASTWHRVEHDFSLAGYVLAALVIAAIAGLVVHRLRVLRSERRLDPSESA